MENSHIIEILEKEDLEYILTQLISIKDYLDNNIKSMNEYIGLKNESDITKILSLIDDQHKQINCLKEYENMANSLCSLINNSKKEVIESIEYFNPFPYSDKIKQLFCDFEMFKLKENEINKTKSMIKNSSAQISKISNLIQESELSFFTPNREININNINDIKNVKDDDNSLLKIKRSRESDENQEEKIIKTRPLNVDEKYEYMLKKFPSSLNKITKNMIEEKLKRVVKLTYNYNFSNEKEEFQFNTRYKYITFIFKFKNKESAEKQEIYKKIKNLLKECLYIKDINDNKLIIIGILINTNDYIKLKDIICDKLFSTENQLESLGYKVYNFYEEMLIEENVTKRDFINLGLTENNYEDHLKKYHELKEIRNYFDNLKNERLPINK